MKIEWNRVTRLSQLIAIVLFVGVFFLGFVLGQTYQMRAYDNALKAELDQMAKDMRVRQAQ